MNQSQAKTAKSAVLMIAALLGLLAVFQAHAWEGDLGGNQYNGLEARRYQSVKAGVIEDIREVVITTESPNAGYAGGALGAILGAVIGNTAGQGKGRMVASAIGGTLGAVAGKVAGDYAGREVKRSAEIIVTMTNGNVISVVQELDSETAQLRLGDRVRLIEGQAVRVVKMRSNVL